MSITKEETRVLLEIIESNSGSADLLCGAYLLLNYHDQAEFQFTKLDEEVVSLLLCKPLLRRLRWTGAMPVFAPLDTT